MRDRHRYFVTALVAAMTLAAMVSVAGATTYQVGGRRFRATYSSVTFGATGIEAQVRCPITLEGSFTSGSFVATRGTRVASVTRATLGSCSGGSATVLSATLPWSINYDSSTGTAPDITTLRLNLVGGAFSIQPSGFPSCLARSTTEAPLAFVANREIRGVITSLRAESASHIPLSGFFCEVAGEGFIEGTSSSYTSPDEEEAGVIVLVDGVGTMLVERNDRTRLVNLNIAAGTSTVLEMLNVERRRSATLVGEPTSTNATAFIVEESGAARCRNTTNLAANLGGNACTIRIRTREGTAAGTTARIRIRYYLGFGVFGDVIQEFEVRA